jgi:hypothetical protein
MVLVTHGQAAVPPAPTPIREDPTRQGKCCVSSSRASYLGTARAILAWNGPRTHATLLRTNMGRVGDCVLIPSLNATAPTDLHQGGYLRTTIRAASVDGRPSTALQQQIRLVPALFMLRIALLPTFSF